MSRSEEFDVLVIGAGPAGSVSAAMIHRAGFKVRVVEKEKFPRFVIGESLLPRCMEALDEAGLLDAVRARKFQEKFGAKFMMGNEVSDFNFEDQFSKGWHWTWQVPRADFDATLINTVASWGVPVSFETAVTAIDINPDETSTTTVKTAAGDEFKIKARFVVDASGYGRVIPRLFNLDSPSNLPVRRALFAHLADPHRLEYDEPNRIIIISYAPGVWVWVIPFSTGNTSVGFVGNPEFFDAIPGNLTTQFDHLINNLPFLEQRFSKSERIFEPRKLEGWSSKTHRFFGNGFVLTGNVTEFLDPVFSSGVMFATVSSHLAAKLVIRKLKGEAIDWQRQYTDELQPGVDTFKSYVNNWYDGTLETIFYAKRQDPTIKRQICSVLAGYVWDQSNPYVRDHDTILKRLAKLVSLEKKITEFNLPK